MYGRRPCLYTMSYISLVGILFSMIDNLWCMIIAKAICGLAMGVSQSTSGRTLEEFVPGHMYGTFMLIYLFMQTISLTITVIISSEFIP